MKIFLLLITAVFSFQNLEHQVWAAKKKKKKKQEPTAQVSEQKLCDDFVAAEKAHWAEVMSTFQPGGENAVDASVMNKHNTARHRFEYAASTQMPMLKEIQSFLFQYDTLPGAQTSDSMNRKKEDFAAKFKDPLSVKLDQSLISAGKSFLTGVNNVNCERKADDSYEFRYTLVCRGSNGRNIQFSLTVNGQGIDFSLKSNDISVENFSTLLKRDGSRPYVFMSNDSVESYWSGSGSKFSPAEPVYSMKREESKSADVGESTVVSGARIITTDTEIEFPFRPSEIPGMLQNSKSQINEWIKQDAQGKGLCMLNQATQPAGTQQQINQSSHDGDLVGPKNYEDQGDQPAEPESEAVPGEVKK